MPNMQARSKWLENLKPYSKKELRAMLPKVGDVLMKRQTFESTNNHELSEPKSCKVVYVNEKHLWYRVQFRNGCHECFKVPEIEKKDWGW